MQLTFFGHASWALETAGKTVLIDPHLAQNPVATASPDEVACDFMLITHAHDDHISDAEAILKRTGALAITSFEYAGALAAKGCNAHPMHLGGKHEFEFGSVKLVLALHGSGVPGGHAVGFLVESEGKKIYFAGDTALTTDMQLLRDVWGPIDVAILPIGSNFTMDPDDAVVAVRFIQPKVCIPCHYNTFPLIAVDADKFKRDVEEQNPGTKVLLMEPNQTATF